MDLKKILCDGMDWVRQDGAVAGCSEHVTKLHVIVEVRTY